MVYLGILTRIQNRLFELFGSEDSNSKNIGVYGPPNSGKTTLCNHISEDVTGESLDGRTSDIEHETRKVQKTEDIEIERNGKTVSLDVFDTPGVETKVSGEYFREEHGLDEEESRDRAREATEGIGEAMHYLRDDIDGVLYVIDSTEDPLAQVNSMVVGIIEEKDIPVLVLANKTDLDGSDVDAVEEAYPSHKVVPLSALEGNNMHTLYDEIAETFG